MSGAADRRAAVRALAAGCVAIACPGALVFGYPGVAAPHWQDAFGASRAAVGATLFFMLAGVGALMFFVGRWQERWGTRRLVLAGEALAGAAMGLAAFAPGMGAVYLWAFAVGAASCFVYLPALTAAQLWWPHRRGMASGLVNLAFAGSAALLAPAFGGLLATLGYRGTNLALALGVVVVGGWASRFVVRPAAGPAAPAALPSLTPRQAVRTGAFWFLWGAWACQGAAGIAMVSLAAAVGRQKGLGAEAAVGLLVAFSLGNGLSRLVMGTLSDRVGRTRTLSATFLAAGLAYLVLPHAAGAGPTAALAAAVGVAFGTLFAVSAPLAVECFGPAHFGAVFGLVFTAYGFVSGALGPWLSGYLLDATSGDLVLVCGYLGALCLLAGGLVLGVRPPVRPT
ncbi:MAG: MFS transporter [Deferrisomatales bacterium]